MPKTPKTDPNKAGRLEQIYAVAARLFCEKGFDATSMTDIADEIGITKPAIYHFIPKGKKALLAAIMRYGMDRLDSAVIQPAKAVPDSEERLRTIITNHVMLVAGGSSPKGTNPITVLNDEMPGLSPAQRRKLIERKREYVQFVRQTLEQLKEEGKLRDVDVVAAAYGLLGKVLWVSRWYRPQGRLDPAAVAAEIVKVEMSGLLRNCRG